MKKPKAVIAALVAHIAFLLWIFYATMSFFEIVTWRFHVFASVILLIHLIGIYGLRMRRKWAKRYSKIVFILYFILQFGALSKAARAGDVFYLMIHILICVFILWLIKALNQSAVEEYLNEKETFWTFG